jgi:hypothetical protein
MIERLNINDAKEWSEMDIADLKNHVAHGATLEERPSPVPQRHV